MYKNRIYRQIAADCTKAYWSSILFYALQLIVSQVAVAYSARMLGVFSAYILNNEIQKGLGCLWQILICVAISVTLPLACSTMGELLMFRASLNHERAVLNRYLNKTYAAAVGLRGSDAQFRLEEDQTQLGIYWNTTGMYLVSVPIVVIYLLWQMVPVMGWFTLFVAAVCCVRIFVPVFFRKKTEEYDRLERESRTKMRNLEQEMLEKPVELCLYGLQSDELARLKCLQKSEARNLAEKYSGRNGFVLHAGASGGISNRNFFGQNGRRERHRHDRLLLCVSDRSRICAGNRQAASDLQKSGAADFCFL